MARLVTRTWGALIFVALISGCSTFGDDDEEVAVDNRSALEIFELAETQLNDGEPETAAKSFDEVERLYPFSQLAKRALIMSSFSYYEARDFPAARTSARRYLDLYPSDEDAAYAQYLIGLTYYDNIADVGRDQNQTRQALQALTEVTRRYPGSDYAREAQLKIDLTRDHLAGKEMQIGRYYLKRGHYLAAVNRFRIVIEEYQTTSQTPEALHRLVEAYLALGLNGEAQSAAAVLGENFVGSEWYSASYALLTGRDLNPELREDSWMAEVYRRVIQGSWL